MKQFWNTVGGQIGISCAVLDSRTETTHIFHWGVLAHICSVFIWREYCTNHLVLTGPFVLIVILSDEMFWICDANSVFYYQGIL